MKAIISTAVTMLILSNANAQAPQFLSNTKIQPEFKTMVVETFKPLKFETKGENVIWNFGKTKFKANGDEVYVVNPKDVNINKSFPDATHVKKVMHGGESIVYEFLKIQGDKYEYLGNVVTDQSFNVTKYSDTQTILKLPFSFGETFNDVFESNVGNPLIVTTSYDAYGTLILPFGTYTNVALVKCVYDYGVTEYKWYQTGPYIRLLATQVEHPDYTYTVAFRNELSPAANSDLTNWLGDNK